MFKQTTCLSFEKYGTILTDLPNDIIICEKKSSLDLLNMSVNKLYFSNKKIYPFILWYIYSAFQITTVFNKHPVKPL